MFLFRKRLDASRTTRMLVRSALWRMLSLLFACIAGVAQQPAHSPTAQTWRISGRVVDAHSGQGLARCVVEITPTVARDRSVSIETSENGEFLFDGLAIGKYALSASRRGYLTQSYEEHEDFSTAIAVGPGLTGDGLLFQLTPQATLWGIVTDEAGEPVRQAQVRLFADLDRQGVRSTRPVHAVPTDDRGMYEFLNVSPGNYFLTASAQAWYARGRRQAFVVGKDPGSEGSESSPELDVAYPTTFYPNATDSDDATPILVKGGERLQANFTLVAQHAVRLRVPVPREQSETFHVSVAQSVFGQMEAVATGSEFNQDGVMEVDGVLPGHYEVTLRAFNAARQEATQFQAEVSGDATHLVEEGSTEDSGVAGKVISRDAKVPSGSIALLSTHPRRRYDGRINQAGDFSMKVMAGTYEVVGFIPQMYLASVTSSNAAVRGRMLEVKSGASPKLQIIAGSGWGEIVGVAELAGHAVGGVMVVLAPENAKDNPILFRRDQSDSDGTFSLPNIIPGHYRLLAIQGGWDLAWADPNVLSRFLKRSIPLDIKANDKLQQTIEVQPR